LKWSLTKRETVLTFMRQHRLNWFHFAEERIPILRRFFVATNHKNLLRPIV
jgi:hypothetical protein